MLNLHLSLKNTDVGVLLITLSLSAEKSNELDPKL
jgi:hypothetical protein